MNKGDTIKRDKKDTYANGDTDEETYTDTNEETNSDEDMNTDADEVPPAEEFFDVKYNKVQKAYNIASLTPKYPRWQRLPPSDGTHLYSVQHFFIWG